MTPPTRSRMVCISLAMAAVVQMGQLRAQRLDGNVHARTKVVLRNSRHPVVDTLQSDGPVDDALQIHGMAFRFRPTEAQSAELATLLEQQQDPTSPLYHNWLTPDEYARRFGLSEGDLANVADWLASEGFRVDYVPKSRAYISFSGAAGRVRDTFATELRRFTWQGKQHFANVREIMVPADLEPLLYPPMGFDDLHDEPMVRVRPRLTWEDGSHALTPLDLAVIYNLGPLYEYGIAGVGQKIVIVGRSALTLDDVRAFRKASGLPPSDPKTILVTGSKDPGVTDSVHEALLDVEYAGGAAPGAAIFYVYATDPTLAIAYAIDQNLAPVISVSFGACEKINMKAGDVLRNIVQQAVAQGITMVAGSGDNGAACPGAPVDGLAVSGLGVGLPASVPEVTAVGGTTFAEGDGQYWSETSSRVGSSALSYIPEQVWNDTAIAKFPSGSGGGASVIYSRPAWQTAPGLPKDNARHVPDIALTASFVHDPYVIFDDGKVAEVGGTSAGTPYFAGIVALLNQFVVDRGIQAKPGLGNINPRLYQLASVRGVFHDVTAGNNIVPCKTGTPDCANGKYGYSAGAGYDDATGLGSIDATNLIANWSGTSSSARSGSVVVPSVDPNPVYQQSPDADGNAWFYTVKLSETGGAPTTLTAFQIDDYDLTGYIEAWFGSTTLSANGSLSVDLLSRDMEVPSDHVFAFAGVDANGQKWSNQVTVAFRGPRPSGEKGASIKLTSDPAVVVKIGKGDPNCAADHPFGQKLILQEQNGVAVALTKFVAGGYDYSDQIAGWFGSQALPASGTLTAQLCWKLPSLPVTLSYEIDGVDSTGQQLQSTLEVDFKDPLEVRSGGVVDSEMSEGAAWPRSARQPARGPLQTSTGMVVTPRSAVGSAIPRR